MCYEGKLFGVTTQNSTGESNVIDVPVINRAYPFNINNDGKLDFISLREEMGSFEDPKPTTKVFYTIISK